MHVNVFTGSKYEGVVYLFAFWIVFYHNFKFRFSELLKFSFLLFIILALYLTYSKASILAFAASLILFSINKIKENGFLYLFNIIKKKFVLIFIILFLTFILELNSDFYLENFRVFIDFLNNFNINFF